MAVIATLLSAKQRELGWKVEIEYAEGVDTWIITEFFNGTTVEELKAFARTKALKIDDIIATFDFTTVIGQSIDVTPIVPVEDPAPTVEELAKIAWLADWHELQRTQSVLQKLPGLATAGRLAFEANLIASLEAGWLDSYLGDV